MRSGHHPTLGILADDLTSAADGAGPFVMRGLSASIGRGRLPRQEGTVTAVDSGARSVSAEDAAARVAALTAPLSARDILYKTVDSTLRGHVAIELEACFRASGRATLVFAPAFPEAGRTTVGGIQRVDGVPVSQTVYGRDPVHPARHSALADLVPASIGNVMLLDAETQGELDAKVAALPDPGTILWVGSPGLAKALARRLAPGSAPPATAVLAGGEILVVVGTANPLSHRQADALRAVAGVTVLRSPDSRQADPAAVLDRLANDALDRVDGGAVAAVIATGGDTMGAILQRLGIDEFEILRELALGFPLCRALDRRGQPLLLAMKAGGFGDDQILRDAVAQFRPPRASGLREAP